MNNLILKWSKTHAEKVCKEESKPFFYIIGVIVGLSISLINIAESLVFKMNWNISSILIWFFIAWICFERLGMLQLLKERASKSTEQGAAANP
jgi:hypothetical protein